MTGAAAATMKGAAATTISILVLMETLAGAITRKNNVRHYNT